MDQPLVTRQGVDAAHEIPDKVSCLGGRCRGLKPSEKTAVLCLQSSRAIPSLLEHLFPRVQLMFSPLLFRNLLILSCG